MTKKPQGFSPPRGRVTKVIPQPFQRPTVSVRGPNHVSKVWRWANPDDLVPGDMVRDHGVFLGCEEMVLDKDGEYYPYFQVSCGHPNSHEFFVSVTEQLWAFTSPLKEFDG